MTFIRARGHDIYKGKRTWGKMTWHDIYKGNLSPILGERLTCEREPEEDITNMINMPFVWLKMEKQFGHIPRDVSQPCFFVLIACGSMYAVWLALISGNYHFHFQI